MQQMSHPNQQSEEEQPLDLSPGIRDMRWQGRALTQQTCYINSNHWHILWDQRGPDKQQLSCGCSTMKHFTLIAHWVTCRWRRGSSVIPYDSKQAYFHRALASTAPRFPQHETYTRLPGLAGAGSKQLSDNLI